MKTITKIHISVTAEDIKRGTPCWPRHCPIALAINRAMPGYDHVVGSAEVIRLPVVSDWYADLPAEAREWRRRFDQGRAGPPFEFDLEVHS